MKVLMINGSPRANSNTRLALEEVGKTLKENGIDYEIANIGTKPVHGCIACGRCGELGRCVFDDDPCNRWAALLAESNALVVGTPTYYGQPNGALLALMQRLLYSQSHLAMHKPAAGIAICRRGGATAALQSLTMMFQLQHMPMVTSQYWNIVYGRAEGQAALDSEGMQTMRALGRNMAFLLKRIHLQEPVQYPESEPWEPMHFIR
ncbi:MAG: flavodoxin family protein [Bacteroidales bacterium]|nr:flavodoxin family protein [Bacteroidales bacterium]